MMTLEEINTDIQSIPFHRQFGLTCIEATDELLTLSMTARSELANSVGGSTLHGGVVSTLIDVAASYLVFADRKSGGATISLVVDFLRPATGPLVVEARLQRRGKTVSTIVATVRDDKSRLVASGRSICTSQ